MRVSYVTALFIALSFSAAVADEAPIVGHVKAVDTAAQILTVESAARGKTRQVVIDVKPETKVIRFVRGAEGGAFKEQPAILADVKVGWTVSVATRHEGDREVAEIIRVVHEK